MTDRFEMNLLMDEIRRYLAAVEAFRAEGREPSWRAERPGERHKPSGRRKRLLDAPIA